MRRHVFTNHSPEASAAELQERLHQSTFYQNYMQSTAWKRKREAVIKRAGNRCEFVRYGERCTVMGTLEVNHKTYQRLGKEWMGDLEALCHAHHIEADRIRAERTRRRFTSWLIGW